MKISPVMAKLIDGMLQPKYDQCKINPDQTTRDKMALLMERKYTKAIVDKEKCVSGVYTIRDYIKKISPNAIQKAIEKLVNNANEGI